MKRMAIIIVVLGIAAFGFATLYGGSDGSAGSAVAEGTCASACSGKDVCSTAPDRAACSATKDKSTCDADKAACESLRKCRGKADADCCAGKAADCGVATDDASAKHAGKAACTARCSAGCH